MEKQRNFAYRLVLNLKKKMRVDQESPKGIKSSKLELLLYIQRSGFAHTVNFNNNNVSSHVNKEMMKIHSMSVMFPWLWRIIHCTNRRGHKNQEPLKNCWGVAQLSGTSVVHWVVDWNPLLINKRVEQTKWAWCDLVGVNKLHLEWMSIQRKGRQMKEFQQNVLYNNSQCHWISTIN